MHIKFAVTTSNEFILRRKTSGNRFLVKLIISLVSYIQLAKISARVQNSRYQNAISRDPIRKMQRCGVRSIALYRRSFDDNTCISIGMLMKRTFFSWIGYLYISSQINIRASSDIVREILSIRECNSYPISNRQREKGNRTLVLNMEEITGST